MAEGGKRSKSRSPPPQEPASPGKGGKSASAKSQVQIHVTLIDGKDTTLQVEVCLYVQAINLAM